MRLNVLNQKRKCSLKLVNYYIYEKYYSFCFIINFVVDTKVNAGSAAEPFCKNDRL